jgi:hypothetical protein
LGIAQPSIEMAGAAVRDSFFPRDNRSRLALAGLALAVFLYLSLFQSALIDDAFITLRYAKTLFQSGTWGFYAGHVSNTATSPLNVILLAAFSFVTGSPLNSVVWLTTTEFIAMALFLRGIGKVLRLGFFAPLAIVGLLCNPLLMSTLGLESILFATLLVAGLYFYLVERFELMAIACGLLTLTRPDGILFFATCLLAMRKPHQLMRTLVLYALCIAPWYFFSWVELGSIVPDTLLIKLNQKWGSLTFANGLYLYFRVYPLETSLSFLFAPLAMLALRRPVRALGSSVYILMAYGAVYFVAYSLLGAPPYHWYYVPVALSVVMLGALAVAQLARDAANVSRHSRRTVAISGLVVPIVGVMALFMRDGIPLHEAWIHTNWATQAQYRSIGEWLRNHEAGQTGRFDGEIGTIAYYCDCMLLDEFSERNWLDLRVRRSRTSPGLGALLSRINYFFYEPQQPFDPPRFMVTYIQLFSEYIRTGQIWQVGTRWKRNGVILYNRLRSR